MDIASLAIQINTSDVSRAEDALDRLGQSGERAEQAARDVGQAYRQAGSQIGGIAGAASAAGDALGRGATAAQNQAREVSELIARLDPAAAAMRRLADEQDRLNQFRAQGLIDPSQFANLNARLEQSRTLLAQNSDAMRQAGISAGQYQQALRMLPMQLTDVAVSLASGMPLWMVAIQQGGQVRDSFGGIGNAASAIVQTLGPVRLGLAGVAAAAATLAAVYQQGRSETDAYNQALILTGNAAGTSADQLAMMAERIDGIAGTQHQAAAALAQLAGTGKFAADQMEAIAAAAVAMEETTGKAVGETVKEFVQLAEKPVEASAKLNAQQNYLTASVYEQIKALKEQGRESEAAKLATDTLAEAQLKRTKEIEAGLGLLDTALIGVRKKWKEMWDAAFDIGRPDTLDEKLADVEERLRNAQSRTGRQALRSRDRISELEFQRESLLVDIESDKIAAQQQGFLKAQEDRRISQSQFVDDLVKGLKSRLAATKDLSATQETLNSLTERGISLESDFAKRALAEAEKTKAAEDAKEAAKEAEQARNKAASEAANRAKQLAEYVAKSDLATSAANRQADAYFRGEGAIAELAKQEKIETEVLRLGEKYRTQLTEAINAQQAATDRLDIGQRVNELSIETQQLAEQARATLQGREALDEYNASKALAVALAGKSIAANSAEAKALMEAIKANQAAAKDLGLANQAEGIVDRLMPEVRLLREYKEEQEALNKAIALHPEKAEEYREALRKLGEEYEQNRLKSSVWGQWTQDALERVDSAFADMWKNVGGGFKSFSDGLKNAFSQLLAELAHMAITRPIVLQIGSALGIGGLAGQSAGIWGSLGGSGAGGSGLLGNLSQAYSLYQAGQGKGLLGSVFSGLKSGGLSGAWTGLQNYGSGLYNSVAGWFGSGSAAGTGATQAGYTGAAFNGWVGRQNLAASLQNIAPWAAAAFSAMQGFSQAGLKGAATGAAGGIGGYYAGAAIGSLAGPLGTAIGGAIGAALGGSLGSSIFGGGWVTKDYGIALSIADGDFLAQQYKKQKKKGGLFSSSKKRYKYSDLDAETSAALQETFGQTEQSVFDLFDALSFQFDEGITSGLDIGRKRISTKGKTEEEIQEAIAEWFGGVADSMTEYLNTTLDAGLGDMDFEELSVFVGNLKSVNEMLTNLNVGLFEASVAGARMAEDLSAVAGGFEALSANAAAYYEQFFSDIEKAEDVLENVPKAFTEAGQTLPGTRAEFRAMVEDIDITAEAGREMFASLMEMAGQADAYYDVLEQRAAEVLQAEATYYDLFTSEAAKAADTLDAVRDQFSGLSIALPDIRSGFVDAVEAIDLTTASGREMYETMLGLATAADGYYDVLEQRAAELLEAEKTSVTEAHEARLSSLNDMFDTASQRAGDLESVGRSLDSALKTLLGSSDEATGMLQEQASATLKAALAFSRAGGSLADVEGLEEALSTASSISSAGYATLEDMQSDQGRAANLIASLQEVSDEQLTTEESILAGLQEQIDLETAAYEAEIAVLDAQLEALNGVNASIQSVSSAIAKMNDSIVAALSEQVGGAAGPSSVNATALIDTLYESILGRSADLGGKAFWSAALAGGMSYQELIDAISSSAEARSLSVRGYADGGMASGLYLAGEQGQELIVSGPARVHDASDTARILSGGADSAGEIKALNAKIDRTNELLYALAKSNSSIDRGIRRQNAVGLPETSS